MTPHPVYIPTGEIRQLRSLLSQRQALVDERKRWLSRARSYLQAAGYKTRVTRSVPRLIESAILSNSTCDSDLSESILFNENRKGTHLGPLSLARSIF